MCLLQVSTLNGLQLVVIILSHQNTSLPSPLPSPTKGQKSQQQHNLPLQQIVIDFLNSDKTVAHNEELNSTKNSNIKSIIVETFAKWDVKVQYLHFLWSTM